ncbi:MAG: hypothetical protein JSR12_11100 [Bacteroidetes bacterium]|nr:hypothetical protein [Bacteroidota bacterium]MBS1642835.1 hypothetical protein [Bacteroidota bacterium]
MENNTTIWAKELDALIAAPQHHKLLFENEWVRVLDTNIPAGEILMYIPINTLLHCIL